MNKLYLLVLLIITFDMQACEGPKIPIEIVNPYNNTPYQDRESYRLIVVPVEYNGWRFKGATYFQHKNVIPLGYYEAPKKYEGKFIIEFLGTLDLYTDSYVSLTFTPIGVKAKDGKLSVSLCLHTQRVDWNI